jgi:hypothetical protein
MARNDIKRPFEFLKEDSSFCRDPFVFMISISFVTGSQHGSSPSACPLFVDRIMDEDFITR